MISFIKKHSSFIIGVQAVTIVFLFAIIAKDQLQKTPKAKKSVVAKKVEQLFQGIPQRGPEIGNKLTPVVIEEFVDMQCKRCKFFQTTILPVIISKYVRTGKVRIRLRILTSLGDQANLPDSRTAARFAYAAGHQNKLWNFTELFFYHQQLENSAYVNDKFIDKVSEKIESINAEDLARDSKKQAVIQPSKEAETVATRDGISVEDMPAFYIGYSGSALQQVDNVKLQGQFFSKLLDKFLYQQNGEH